MPKKKPSASTTKAQPHTKAPVVSKHYGEEMRHCSSPELREKAIDPNVTEDRLRAFYDFFTGHNSRVADNTAYRDFESRFRHALAMAKLELALEESPGE